MKPLYKTLSPLARRYGSVFDPSTIAGLKVWYDFSDTSRMFQDTAGTTPVTADWDVVGRVNDKTANANNATQGTTSKKPLYKTGVQNGLGGVKFDNADDFLQMTSNFAGASQTIFACVKWAGSTDQEELLFGRKDTSTSISFWGYDDNTKGMRFFCLSGNYFGGLKLTDVANTARVHTLSVAALVGTSYINGSAQSGTVTIGENFSAGLLGCYANTATTYARFFGGHFLEVLAYDTALSAGNQALVEGYLNSKWAVY